MTETSQPVTDQPAQVASDSLETALLAKWQVGTPLKKSLAEQIARENNVSPAKVYALRKRLTLQRASEPEPVLKSEPTPSDGKSLEVTFVGTEKPRQEETSSPTEAPPPPVETFDEWDAEDIKPIFQSANGLIELGKLGEPPQPQVVNQISDLGAQTFNAFKIPKGEAGGKYLILASFIGLTLTTYAPYLFKALAKKKEAPA